MMELVIFGRGGQGGVTLAKLIAETYFLQGKFVQAFGVYAAERSGAPLNAFVRVDDEEITNRNQIYRPDHVVVLDRSLIGERIAAGLKPGGWILLNSTEAPEDFAGRFPGYRVAAVDATGIAVENKLGTRATPIVNTTLLGAVARVFDLPFEWAEAAITEFKFPENNVAAARTAFESVQVARDTDHAPLQVPVPPPLARATSILDPSVGGRPAVRTGSWATQRPHRREWTPPCNDGCLAGNDVRGFVAAAGEKDLDRALAILHQTSPFPGVCGRVCPAPCMEACHRNGLDEGVNVRDLERYVGDHGKARVVRDEARKESVGIVGSGPGGLAAAYTLGKLGYEVTLYEAMADLGGVMRTGIPAYRLPPEVLDREIGFILEHGVRAKTGQKIDRQRLLELSYEHDAVFVATGLQESRALSLGIEDPETVIQGITFLDDARRGEATMAGDKVVVVGGGNTAMDAARTALRLGAREVKILYRRTREEMPAIHEEIEEALEEGIALHELVAPVSVKKIHEGLSVTCRRMKLGEPDESGRRRPVPDTGPGSEFNVSCTRLVLALGQSGDLSIFPEGAEITEEKVLLGLAGSPVFAGGDLTTGDGTVAAAIASGRKAAFHVHRTLTGEDLFPTQDLPLIPEEEMKFSRFERIPRTEGARLPVGERGGFAEVRRGLPEDAGHAAVAAEAARCLSCGACNECDVCREHCPEGVLLRDGEGYEFDYDYCKGCGLCAYECPRGVVYMEQI